MRRKKLTEGPNDLCICGHKRNQHKNEKLTWCDGLNTTCNKCDWTCTEFFDVRHCKIKSDDPALKYCTKFQDYITQEDLWRYYHKNISRPTISRRITLFEKMHLVERSGFAPVGQYSARCLVYQFNQKRYEELVKLGVIA